MKVKKEQKSRAVSNAFDIHIKAKSGWFDIDIKELWKYRDLIFLFVKRNYSTRYKQTILGPLWLIFNPMITVILYSVIFGRIAGLSTDGVPKLMFYLCSNSIWSYFAICITETANTFTANSAILGKVYFPRLVMPISAVLTGFVDLIIQMGLIFIVFIIYFLNGITLSIGWQVFLVPILILQTALLGLGCGIIVAACTTKYRDLIVLVSFGVQLWMYASPVVYTISGLSERIMNIYMMNPMAPIITTWRYSLLGTGTLNLKYWGLSWIITVIILFIGIVLFSKVEKTFMDTV